MTRESIKDVQPCAILVLVTSPPVRALLLKCGVLAALSLAGCHRGPTEARCDGPFRVEGEIVAPRRISGAAPQYTEEARRQRIEGPVVLDMTVTCTGTVEEITVVESLPAGLTEATVEAVSSWRFAPATLHGAPVSVFHRTTVNFQLL